MRKVSARQLADRMVELGMLEPAKSAEVLAMIDEYGDSGEGADEPLGLRDLVSYLPEFGVAVSIHAEDVDFVDDYYRSVFEEDVPAVTGGAVVVTDVTLLESEDGDEWLYFVRNGEPVWWSMEHESEDYVDMLSVLENFGDFDPGGDDPRSFHLHRPPHPEPCQDQEFVFATREQALVLRDEFGIDFDGLAEPPSGPADRSEATAFLSGWTSGMVERLERWRREHLPPGFPFDYSLKSLDTLERLVLNTFPDKAAFEAAQDGPFVTGAVAYLGETLVRAESGAWDYRVDTALYDRVPIVVSDTPTTFRAIVEPSYQLRRVADHRGFGLLAEAAAELRRSYRQYETALRLLEADDEDIDDDE